MIDNAKITKKLKKIHILWVKAVYPPPNGKLLYLEAVFKMKVVVLKMKLLCVYKCTIAQLPPTPPPRKGGGVM